MARRNPGEILFTTAGPNIRPNPPRAVSITWDAGGEEFRVRVVGNSREDYFTNDYDDAVGTAKVMAQGGEVSDKTPKSKRPKSNPRKRNPPTAYRTVLVDAAGNERKSLGSFLSLSLTVAKQSAEALVQAHGGRAVIYPADARGRATSTRPAATVPPMKKNGAGSGLTPGKTLAIRGVTYTVHAVRPDHVVVARGSKSGDGDDMYAVHATTLPALRAELTASENARLRMNGRKRRNGAATSADPVAARELELYIENEAALVGPGNTIGQAIMRNLAGKILRGTYDRTKSWKAWSHLVDEGAKRYTREFGEGKGYGAFTAATRRMVAVSLAEVFEAEIESGGLNAAELAGVKSNPRKRR